MDSTLTDVAGGGGRLGLVVLVRDACAPLPSRFRCGTGRELRYICKMDYVGFAEFNIDTDSS